MINFELIPNWTLAQEQAAHLRKTAARLLDLRVYSDAELGLILPSHSSLQRTAAMQPCPRHLPAAVADVQHADMGWGHLWCLPSLRAGGACRHQTQQVLGEGSPNLTLCLACGSLGSVPGCRVL